MAEIVSTINFASLLIASILSFYFYIRSVTPLTLQKKIGDKAWKISNRYRILADTFWTILIVNLILWIWFPLNYINYPITDNYLILLIVSLILMVPFIIITIKAFQDAGTETVKASEKTEMYGGIYNYIRHPQMLGATPIILLICCLLNSLTLLIIFIILMLIIVPIVIYYEEKDLILRFGDSYLEYRKKTGAIIPKFWNKKK
jgi:methanethiol S-methyltransferase